MAARIVSFGRIVTLQQSTVTRDPTYGSEIESWHDVDQVWADVNQIIVPEKFENEARRTVALRNAKIRIHWRQDVRETWRVIHAGLVWEIKGIGEIGYRRELELICQTDVNRRFEPAPESSERDPDKPTPPPEKPDELAKRSAG